MGCESYYAAAGPIDAGCLIIASPDREVQSLCRKFVRQNPKRRILDEIRLLYLALEGLVGCEGGSILCIGDVEKCRACNNLAQHRPGPHFGL